MALQFILGTPGSGKSRCLFQKIIEESMQHPEQNFLIIVPEQFSMQTQTELVRLHPRGGILNIDVLSLNRLAYRIFDEIGADTRELLEESGKSIVLRRISLEKKKEMPYLGRHLKQPGSISEIKSVLSELMQYAVTPEALLTGSASVSPELRIKLQDIAALLSDYRAYCREHFMNAEEVPTYLARLIGRSAFLRNCTVAFDGFTGCTPVQLPVLRELLTHARNVYVTAAIDRTWAKGPGRDSDLYLMSRAVMRSLEDLAAEVRIPVLPPVFIEDGPESRLARSPELRFLEKHIFRNRRALYEGKADAIRIASAENPHEEVRSAARRIRRMIREKGFRYRDIAVIAGDLASYGDLIRRIFPEYGIPFFVDEKRTVLHHPYIEFLRAAMQIITEGWSAGAVFRLLRTGLTDLEQEAVDRLENYVLALGIRSRAKWSETWTLHYKGQDEKEFLLLNGLREQVLALLAPVHDAFTAPGSTASDKTKALYLLSVGCDVQIKLAAEEEKLREDGQLSLAGEYAQIYAIVMRLFDKMADILGEHVISARDYRALFESALTETRIGIIPPTGDQVTIGDVERSRLGEIKALLFIGVNDGVVPHPARTNGILTEADRTVLESLGIRLAPLPPEELLQQRFYLYLALTKPSEALFLSCSRTDPNGAALKPSFLLRTVSRLFPHLETEHEGKTSVREIETPLDGLHELPLILAETLSEDERTDYLELYRSLVLHDPDNPGCAMLAEAASARKPADHIGEKNALALYGTSLKGSVTRLERFASCAFSHFAAYGLRLSERAEFTYSGMDRGNVLHEALENYACKVRQSGRLWQDLPSEERELLADTCIENAAATYSGRLLHDSAGMEYELVRLKRMMRRTVEVLTLQLSHGDFIPSGFEVDFRENDFLSLEEQDPSRRISMILNGKIDRIDICETDSSVLVKIIDYKSGTTAFDLSQVYYGLQLQLVLYLRAAMNLSHRRTGKTPRPAGIFYYNIDDPVIETDPDAAEEEKLAALMEKLKPNGILSGEREVLSRLDRELYEGKSRSVVIPAALTKKEVPTAASSTIPPESFDLLMRFAAKKAAEIACGIMSGKSDADPYRMKNGSACDYCPYLSVCGLDRRIPGYHFRDLEKQKNDDIWQAMEAVLNAGAASVPEDHTTENTVDPEAEGKEENHAVDR